MGEPKSMGEFVVKSIYYGSNIKCYVKKNPNIAHIIPVRPSFFKREYIAYLGRKWLPGVFLIPMFKTLQAMAVSIGILLTLKTNPYTEEDQRAQRGHGVPRGGNDKHLHVTP